MSHLMRATRFRPERDRGVRRVWLAPGGIFSNEMPLALKRAERLRRVAPLATAPAAAFAVHQLRYWLAFGRTAGAQLQAQGHSYLHSLVPWIALLLAVAVGVFLRAMGRALGGSGSLPRHTLSFTALWLICAASLVLIYASQEFLEGLFAAGHPGGLVGIFGYGGWWAVPAAIAVGLVLAAVFHGLRWALCEVARRHRRRTSVRRASRTFRLRDALVARMAPLALGWSGRGPPR